MCHGLYLPKQCCLSGISGGKEWIGKKAESGKPQGLSGGLKKVPGKGVPILIDGKEADESQWDKIFEIHEDGSFYMGDYVLEEVMDCQEQKAVNRADQEFIGEPSAGYGKRKRLKEIRFDLVYYR